jgi:DNA-binding MarR family transcriptional regulator
MKQDIIDSLVHSIFRFRQIELACRAFSPSTGSNIALQTAQNISMAELVVLRGIKGHVFESSDLTVPHLLCISRAAVSKMLGNMEQKGYIKRDINKANRRKQSLSITPKGSAIVDEHEHKFTELLTKIVDEFGEKETKQLITLATKFLDTVEKIKEDMQL